MFETGVRQFRMAMGIVWGRRISPRNVERLIGDALATLAEFGEPGDDVGALIDGPLTDPQAREEAATANLRRTARRLAATSPFYARRFAAANLVPARVDLESLRRVPVTTKKELLDQAADFRCTDVAPYLATRTTGTTGRPVEIWLSRYEMELWPAIGGLGALLRDDLRPTDMLQVHVSSRATATVSLDAATCRLIGAGCRLLGVIPPDEALDSLTDGQVTLLSSSPSYLAELLVAARRRGLGPSDFRLRRIDVGGEVLSSTVARAAQETFGAPVNDLFGMTEVIPVTGRTCSQQHLHHDINTGLVEFLDLETGEPAAPGALASVVITPYHPYRECMPVFRYDTRDVVRRLPDEQLSCETAGLPATSKMVGKADQLLRLGPGEWVTPRQLVEAVESLPSQPWPARFRARLEGAQLRLTLPESAVAGLDMAAAREHFAAAGLDVALELVPDELATSLRHLRSDLRESTFVKPTPTATPAPVLIGERP